MCHMDFIIFYASAANSRIIFLATSLNVDDYVWLFVNQMEIIKTIGLGAAVLIASVRRVRWHFYRPLRLLFLTKDCFFVFYIIQYQYVQILRFTYWFFKIAGCSNFTHRNNVNYPIGFIRIINRRCINKMYIIFVKCLPYKSERSLGIIIIRIR